MGGQTIYAGVPLTDEQAQEIHDYCEYYIIADVFWNLAHGITCPPNQPKIPISDREVFRESLVEELAERKRLARLDGLREARRITHKKGLEAICGIDVLIQDTKDAEQGEAQEVCSTCSGIGSDPPSEPDEDGWVCPECSGTGQAAPQTADEEGGG